MRLKVTQLANNKHLKMVTCLGWTSGNELYSASDGKVIMKWDLNGKEATKVAEFDSFATDFKWYAGTGNAGSELFVIGCSDGTFRLMSKNGRTEKSVQAHAGAITACAWNYEGTALATAGEDGFVKQWSRSGNLRSKLTQTDSAIYSVCWSPDQQNILYCCGRKITIKPLQVSAKPVIWKAHEGTVLKVDWNPINNLIISGGEDCRYKVWDSYGRQLYSSQPTEFSVTSVKWAPNGDFFAVGGFNMISLCDKTGWTHSRSRTESGSILALDWTSDGTHLAGAGANGAVCFGQIVERSLEWRNYEVTLNEHNQVVVLDVLNESGSGEEKLDFGDPVIEMAMGYDNLIVATNKTCYVYNTKNFSTPHVFDLKGTVNLILQSDKYFMVVDNIKGMQIYNYDARLVSNPRLPSLRPQYLKTGNVTLSNDCLAIIDRTNPSQVMFLDTSSGKQLTDTLKHQMEIVEVALSQTGLVSDRKLIFIDRNRDLYIAQIHDSGKPFKLTTMVDSAMWNDTTDILAAVSDSQLLVWYYPNCVYVDNDMVDSTRGNFDASKFGKLPRFVNFFSSRCTIRRADGALQTAQISPFPALLYKYSAVGQWDRCTRLCRFVKDNALWAVLAVMAMNGKQLDTAEVALAAIDEADKLNYIQRIKKVPSAEGRDAEMKLFRRQTDQAESILLQANLIYRAIEMNMRVFRWERALDLAIKHKTHADTVLGHRQKYLEAMGRKETDKRFIQYAKEVPVDWAAINSKVEHEAEKERERGTPYVSKSSSSSSNNYDSFAGGGGSGGGAMGGMGESNGNGGYEQPPPPQRRPPPPAKKRPPPPGPRPPPPPDDLMGDSLDEDPVL